MRNIIILVLIIVALAIVRSLIGDVSRAVSKAMKSEKKPGAAEKPRGKTGRFVKDPHTGAYIDEETAIRAEIDGEAFYFESSETRDAYLRARSS